MRPSGRLAVLLSAASLCVGAHAEAKMITRCGTVVADDAVLARDLRCEGPGVILRNPRSVLHLNGHTIASTRTCAEGAAPSGIVVERTAEGSQILGPGLVTGFVTGVALGDVVRVTVRDVRIADSCALGMLIVGADGIRVRDVMLHRNGAATADGGALRVETSARLALDGSEIFANASGGTGAAVDLRDCDRCRLVANRIVGNRGTGLRLDTESAAAVVERNVVLDHRPYDVVDQSSDGVFALNVFERADGIRPPALWPLPGPPAPAMPAPAGCGVMTAPVHARQRVTLACPQDPGTRTVRNSVVAYRLLNVFTHAPAATACDGTEVRPADAGGGGAVTCTNPDSVFPMLLEVTCCLN